MGFRSWLSARLVEFLTQPIANYERRGWNDLDALKRHIRKGDVVLVEGDHRVSSVIRLLTQSTWSHAALYVGDELLRRGGELAERARADCGAESQHMIVEALMPGVVASPLAKYVDFNIRICRPRRLRPEHLKTILDEAVAAIGWRYDLRNVLDLARYLVPVTLVPQRLRRTALHFGSGTPTEVICSSLVGKLFARVRYPVAPIVECSRAFDAPDPQRKGLLRRLFGHEGRDYSGLFRMRHPTLLTPRDFDLSPYFDVLKSHLGADGGFDYERIQWADDLEQDPER